MSHKITNTLICVIIVVSSSILLANSMTRPLEPDEQTYCTAGALLTKGKMIYRDFSYPSQMPYHPLLCAVLFKAFNTTHFLLVGRILSCLCDIFVVVCIVGIYRRLFSPFPLSAMILALSAAVLYVFNPFIDYAGGLAWNNNAVILCIAMSFWLFISTDFRKKSKYWRIAIIAALLTLATGMRITAVLVQLLFFIFLLAAPADSIKQRFKTILPFVAATAIVAIWPVYTIALAPRAFFLNLYSISVLNGQWLHETGMFYSKPYFVLIFLTTRGCFALILIAIYLCAAVAWKRRELKISTPANSNLAVLLAVVFFAIAFMMPAIWTQHLAMPVPFIIISFAFPLLYLRKLNPDANPNKRFKLARILMIACAAAAAASLPHQLQRVPKLFDLQNWTPLHLHRIAEDIAEKTESPKLILTLAPLYALEGGCDIYDEFSSGPFVYRVAERLSPADRRLVNTISPENLEELIEKSPPSAMVLGIEAKIFEVAFFQTAATNPDRWESKVYEKGPIVYFRR